MLGVVQVRAPPVGVDHDAVVHAAVVELVPRGAARPALGELAARAVRLAVAADVNVLDVGWGEAGGQPALLVLEGEVECGLDADLVPE